MLDTTSHAFDWQVYQLGDHGYLEDVAIVNENDIWVVGQLYQGDSNYNAAHWDGNEWKYIIIAPQGFKTPITAIYSFSEDEIWFGKSGLPVRYNGETFHKFTPANSTHPGQPSISAIWGKDKNDIYFVGAEGWIVHYNGTDFRRLNSPTEVDLVDVWGTPAGSNVWACGFEYHNATTVLLEYDTQSWYKLYEVTSSRETAEFAGSITSVWTNNSDSLYILNTGGMYHYSISDQQHWYEDVPFQMAALRIRGNTANDIMICGEYGVLWHYNGVSWHTYEAVYHQSNRLVAVEIKGETAVAVGVGAASGIQSGLVVIGTRE